MLLYIISAKAKKPAAKKKATAKKPRKKKPSDNIVDYDADRERLLRWARHADI